MLTSPGLQKADDIIILSDISWSVSQVSRLLRKQTQTNKLIMSNYQECPRKIHRRRSFKYKPYPDKNK